MIDFINLSGWLESCTLCPNLCAVNRLAGQRGKCRLSDELLVSSADLHFGEEPVLVGRGGSGTIFFTACNLSCRYCQNYEISQLDYGKPVTEQQLADIMLTLQSKGAENINLVTPTHQAARIINALALARRRGLTRPIVYNCGGYENTDFLREIDGWVDIYMPDFKYGSNRAGQEFSGVDGYTDHASSGLQEMYRQVGDLREDSRGVAVRGLLVRHLVLPGNLAHSNRVIDFVADLCPNTYVNIMDQYHPCYLADGYARLNRRCFRSEVNDIIDYARERGLTRIG